MTSKVLTGLGRMYVRPAQAISADQQFPLLAELMKLCLPPCRPISDIARVQVSSEVPSLRVN